MLRLFFPSIEEINGPKVQLMCPAREKNNGLASEVVLLVGFINRGRNGVGVPDPVRKETTHERERNQEHRPPHPVRRILGRRASGSVPADENRLEPGSKVDQAVDDPDGRARVLRPCEVSGRSAGEDSVHTNDAEGNDEDGATREPQVPGQSTAHEHERNEHEDVEDDSHGSPPRSEEPIRDPARGKGAGNTADEQSKTPVVADPEVLGEPNLFRELGVPLHDPIPKEAARELHDADHLQDRMREDLPEHGLDRFTLTTRREHGLTSLEVLEASFSRGVAQPGEHQDPEDREKDGRDEEDGPVLVVSARAESEHRLEDRCPEAKVFLRSRATRVHDGESPVKGKENACGDEDAEMVENVPRSRTWNQGAFTVTIETAPKLWKYMLRAKRTVKVEMIGMSQPSRVLPYRTSPIAKFTMSAPMTPINMVRRPPTLSVSGPFTRNDSA